jgi:hypothetical protein
MIVSFLAMPVFDVVHHSLAWPDLLLFEKTCIEIL